jgi:high-affinity iron transporter
MKIKNMIVIVLLLLCVNTFGSNKQNELAVHLLSYLAQDYGEAVHDGEITSKEEYQEQIDFITEVIRISESNNYSKDLKTAVLNLNNKILQKDKVKTVSDLATRLKSDILKRYNLLTYPTSSIDLKKAKELYTNNCLSCHGDQGNGDGLLGVGLEPAPTNFNDLDRMHNVSPYGAFNTISLGVTGTGMAAHDYLSEEDRWSLSYYITEFRFKRIKRLTSLNLNIKESSALSDNEIKKIYDIDDKIFLGVLASVRDIDSSNSGRSNKGQLDIHLSKAIKDLKESFVLYQAGKINEAKDVSLMAYLKGVEPVEGILRSDNAGKVSQLEGDLSKYRHLINKKASSDDLSVVLEPILTQLEEFRLLGEVKTTSSSSFLLSFGIVLREAFEVGLILFLLLGLTQKSKATVLNRHIHAGWVSSLLIGVVLFVIVELFFEVSGELAESIEGYTAIFASLMLFYVGYWLHKNTDIQKIKDMMVSAVEDSVGSGKGTALFFIAFAACFREVFETILFLKIIIIDGHEVFYVGFGALLAIVLTMIIITFAVRYSIKLNLKYLFSASTLLILGLSIIFLGKGIGALQKTDVLSQTRVDLLSVPALGFNSTLEVLIPQLIIIIMIIFMGLKKYKRS